MTKLKSKSSAKKRFKRTASGVWLRPYAGKRHNMRCRSQKRIREARGMTAVHATDAGRMAIYLPYA
ncbi:MAG: 50S ribosomal protein L35 [Holosporaceae bacterium]|jgi:large subunit ribosomal protein L35|nr:50S ribosomal protein L35 [Alphaproteobacteria bacterium]MCA3249730.1 50S ribosomal protein L35 [Rhodospirillaceae bacterium]